MSFDKSLVDPSDAAIAAVKAERERVLDIRVRVKMARLDDIFAQKLIDDNTLIEEVFDKISDIVNQEVSSGMLDAARNELDDRMRTANICDIGRGVLRALAAAANVQDREKKRRQTSDGKSYYLSTAACDVVATAFWMWSEDVDFDSSLFHHSTLAGNRLLGFAKGIAAANAMDQARDMIEEEEFFDWGLARGARDLVFFDDMIEKYSNME